VVYTDFENSKIDKGMSSKKFLTELQCAVRFSVEEKRQNLFLKRQRDNAQLMAVDVTDRPSAAVREPTDRQTDNTQLMAVDVTDRPSAAVREPTDEELKFTGLNRGEIPSKSFQRLQSMTGAGKYTSSIVTVVVVMVQTVLSSSSSAAAAAAAAVSESVKQHR